MLGPILGATNPKNIPHGANTMNIVPIKLFQSVPAGSGHLGCYCVMMLLLLSNLVRMCICSGGCVFCKGLLTYDKSTTEEGKMLASVVASTAFDALPQLRIASVLRHSGPQAPPGLEQRSSGVLPVAALVE